MKDDNPLTPFFAYVPKFNHDHGPCVICESITSLTDKDDYEMTQFVCNDFMCLKIFNKEKG